MPASPFTPMIDAHLFGELLAKGYLPRGVSYRQAFFLSVLFARPSLTRADYQSLTNVSHNTAHRDLAELEALGFIERLGAGPSCRYQLATTISASCRPNFASELTLESILNVPQPDPGGPIISPQSPQFTLAKPGAHVFGSLAARLARLAQPLPRRAG